MKYLRALALASCALVPWLARAELQRQHAGACDVVAPVPEDPALRWDYWWSGRCAGGLGTGPGFLVQSMQGGGFGDVYAATLVEGRMQGAVTAWGSMFLGAEWTRRAGRADAQDGEPGDWQPAAEVLPRFALPLALQQALDRFAEEVGHPQMPALAVPPAPLHCPAFVDVQGRPAARGPGTDVPAYIRAHGGPEVARHDALVQALAANAARERTPARPDTDEPRRLLALASAVAGCARAP